MVAAESRESEIGLALGGLGALLVGIGFGRFAYTALVPALIQEGWATATTAGYLAAANFAGYLAGALLSGPVARIGDLARTIRLALAVTVVAFAASAVDLGPAWLSLWRFVPGFTGAITMVVVPMAILARLPLARRPRAVGIMFTGIGLGVAFSGTLVPALARLGVAVAWQVLAAATLVVTVATWRLWARVGGAPADGAAASAAPAGPPPARLALAVLAVAYALDAAGFVPHTVYWVDFIARALGLGYGVGGTQWILFGLGAMAGPVAVGWVAARIGFGPALITALLTKAAMVALPVFDTSLAALSLSSLAVGALTPGTATLAAGYVAEIAGPARQRAAWGWMTSGFAATQAASASAYATVLGGPGGYLLLFEAGAALLVVAAALTVASRRLR